MDFNRLIELISTFSFITIDESWGYLEINSNNGKLENLQKIKILKDYLVDVSFANSIQIKIDNTSLQEDDLDSYLDSAATFSSWKININKLLFTKSDGIDETKNFFYSIKGLENWISGLSAFDKNNPFHKKINLVVNELDDIIVGQNFKIIPFNYNGVIEDSTIGESLPDFNKINETVHSLTNDEILINPLSFVYQTNSKSDVVISLNKLACISLSASVVNEIISNDFVTIDGIRRVNIKLFDNEDTYDKKIYDGLLKLVKWIYEEKTVTRQKLFNERITLELDDSKTYVSALHFYLDNAFSQAIQRYNFIILDRKDKYISELKDLLKDVRTQSDLYAQKIRTLLNNLLRDILAAIVLIGFTIFTKFSDNLQLDKISLLNYVFYFLAIYYLISAIIQAITDVTDIYVSKNELLYWKTTTKELIPEKDFKSHIDNSLRGRIKSLRILYPSIIILYLLLSYTCYKFPTYFHSISSETKVKNNNDKVFRHPNKPSSSPSSRK